MQIIKKNIFDVCIIGSGAAGGFMAKELTEAGARVLLIEAGRDVKAEELPIHDWPYELPRRGFGFDKQAALYPDDIRNSIEYRGKDRIGVDRIRVLGGRTLHWNANCFRFSAADFREESVDGVEEDWPLSYEEIAPFYSYVERIVGICGTRESLDVLPDGEFFAPPPKFRCAENLGRRACEKLGIKMIPTRKALATKQFGNRPPCHYCGHCMDVCDVGSIFTSANTLLPKALRTGNLSLRMNALARKISVDERGRASGVSIIDRTTKKEEEVYAKLIVVSCASIESARLLLNSASERFPNGLSNSNDLVGRYLTGHSQIPFTGYLKDLVGASSTNLDGATDHSYIPRYNHRRKTNAYKGGFGMQVQYASSMYPYHAKSVDGFGPNFKGRVRKLQPAMLQMGGYGKVIARKENRVTVNQRKVDRFGIPVPVVHFEFCDNDRNLYKDLVANIEEIYHTAGAELVIKSRDTIGGFASHETGTCRMGLDPKTSVLNPFCQTHEIPNLFVVDGSCFTTFPEKNPTLTIMALAVRSARFIVQGRKKMDL